MNEDNIDLELEQERYELFAGPTYNFNFNRRQFLKAFSGGIALIVPVTNLIAQQEQGESGRRGNERVPENGQILNGKFSQYRLPRFSDVPVIEVVLLDRKDLPSAGAGETPIVGLAPAVANAIFDLTNVRLRSLPLAPEGIVKRG